MQQGGIKALYAKPKTSIKEALHRVYPYLLKGMGMDIVRANQVWQVDITYCVPGTQGEHGCLNESRTYLKYLANAQGVIVH